MDRRRFGFAPLVGGSVRPLAAVAVLVCAGSANAAITYLGVGSLSGTDLSGLSGKLEDGITAQNQIGAVGSAIAYTGAGNQYLLSPDRGPNANSYAGGAAVDNTQSYIERFQQVQINVTYNSATSSWQVAPTLTGTTLLSSATPLVGSAVNNPSKTYFTGLSSGFDAANSPNSMRLDVEGMRISDDGTKVYVSDEYGPFIEEFDRATGQRIRSIAVPAAFNIAHPSALGDNETSGNTSGRQSNRGMEGLAITPDGKTLVGIMQSPLIQDGALNGTTKVGTNVRIVTIDLQSCSSGSMASCATKEYLYQLSNGNQGVSEIVAVNDHEFLVDERDGSTGGIASKKLYKIDLTGATDISTDASLPRTGTPAGVTAVSKSLFLNLQTAVNTPGGLPEKIEGLAFGPDLADGRHLLLVTNDNDFTSAPSNIYAFAVDQSDLPGFQAQQYAPVPLPAALPLFGMALAGLGAVRRRRDSIA